MAWKAMLQRYDMTTNGVTDGFTPNSITSSGTSP